MLKQESWLGASSNVNVFYSIWIQIRPAIVIFRKPQSDAFIRLQIFLALVQMFFLINLFVNYIIKLFSPGIVIFCKLQSDAFVGLQMSKVAWKFDIILGATCPKLYHLHLKINFHYCISQYTKIISKEAYLITFILKTMATILKIGSNNWFIDFRTEVSL